MKITELYSIYKQHPQIQTDTRKLKKGELFFALKGPNFNGNKFIKGALDAGAAYVIADEQNDINDERFILVDDVLTALQQLAKYHRDQFSIPFIAITGSNGKTTTKELLHQVLSTQYKTYTTEGNLNNHIGVPLTILKIKDDAEMAVIEMGANHLKEIASYCKYAKPTHGLITNIGKAHLEGFGSEENVKIGKGELFDYLKKHDGIAFVNSDDKAVNALGDEMKNSIYFGSKDGNCKGVILENSPFLKVKIKNGNDLEISTHLVGDYNLPNIVAAACVGSYFKIKDGNIKQSMEGYIPSNSRSQWMSIGTNDIILDAYNANPGSMKA
ncbi:MAG: UDP-N-acetylmuramoyl-tripeptide--D-alanyl-D-alanine ligase, partial [Ginsengibacter sp.]